MLDRRDLLAGTVAVCSTWPIPAAGAVPSLRQLAIEKGIDIGASFSISGREALLAIIRSHCTILVSENDMKPQAPKSV